VFIVRMFAAEAELFAVTLDLNKLGMAIPAMIRMIATTISSSISEKPFSLRMIVFTLDLKVFLP
jgi:hypothetical protein